MKHIRLSRSTRRAASVALIALGLLGSSATASAGWLDSLFGSSEKAVKGDSKRRDWVLHEFTVVRLAAREADAPPNQHPQQFNAENLHRLLAQVRTAGGAGSEPLFAADELGELIEPLVQAFENARPNDDVLLLSSARRGSGVLLQPFAVTARLFVQSGNLQLIVNDARYEFMNRAIGTRQQPVFTYGSRARAGTAVLRSDAATAVRPDWLAMSMAGTPAAAAALPAVGAGPAVGSGTGPAAPAAAAPVAAPSNDIEQRLTVLKRLREKGLISEEEYVQKRKEILSQL